jgi:hypothetical protein
MSIHRVFPPRAAQERMKSQRIRGAARTSTTTTRVDCRSERICVTKLSSIGPQGSETTIFSDNNAGAETVKGGSVANRLVPASMARLKQVAQTGKCSAGYVTAPNFEPWKRRAIKTWLLR